MFKWITIYLLEVTITNSLDNQEGAHKQNPEVAHF